MTLKLIFPNLQYLEGRTICQCFTAHVLRRMEQQRGVKVVSVDFRNMQAEIEGEMDLDGFFKGYADTIIKQALDNYPFTMSRVRIGQAPRNIPDSRFAAETLTTIGAPLEGGIGRQEKELLFRIDNLYKVRDTPYRPFQTEEEVASGKEACPACGLVDGGKDTITDDISLSGDKARYGLPGPGYRNLEGCKRCATALKAVSALRLLWRIVFLERRGNETLRHTFVPIFQFGSTSPENLREIEGYMQYLANFRASRRGGTETDFIFNCFRMQPILAKLTAQGKLGFAYYLRSGAGIKTSVTDSVRDTDRVRKVAEFADMLNQHFPREWLYASAEADPGTVQRTVSDSALLYAARRDDGLREFFWQMSKNRRIPFTIVVGATMGRRGKDVTDTREKKIGEMGGINKEYLLDTSKIAKMDEYWWDNPLVRLSTFFVAELAGGQRAKEMRGESARPPDQVINDCMSELDEFPESEKAPRVRRYVEKITDKGNSYLLHSVQDSFELLNAFEKALYACTPRQLKEIVRNMRIYATSYVYEKRERKDRIFEETMRELGFEVTRR